MSQHSFVDIGVPEDLAAALAASGITAPFPIQEATLPDALAGLDVCGRAPTGSGKTLAFGIAAVVKTGRSRPRRPQALILVPTRELAAQVERVLAPLAAARGCRVATVYGGVGYGPQRAALRRGVDILVACPGRLEDLLSQNDLSLADVGFVVLDEADRMADMGFLPAVRRLLDATRAERQTLLFSATLDGDVEVVIRTYQRDPRKHSVEERLEDAGDVRHAFWRADRSARVTLTAQLITAHGPSLVFCRTRHGADRLSKQLERAGLRTAAIHGSRSQPQRERALHQFSSGRVQALIATDVAARGIHVDGVACVVHYDPAGSSKDYVHRSGRTGRAGADGFVVSLVTGDDTGTVGALQRELRFPAGLSSAEPDRLDAGVVWRAPEASPATPARPPAQRARPGGRPARRRPRRGARSA